MCAQVLENHAERALCFRRVLAEIWPDIGFREAHPTVKSSPPYSNTKVDVTRPICNILEKYFDEGVLLTVHKYSI